MEYQQEIEIPPFFLCPISLEIMRDPVTVFTGITYERDSIERWIFTNKKNFCPVTKQILIGLSDLDHDTCDIDLTPNHTLRRLIQSWCTLNASYGIERFPTPRPPLSRANIVKLINESKLHPAKLMDSLQKLKSIAIESGVNRRVLESSNVIDFLSSVIKGEDFATTTDASDQALSILYHLQISSASLKHLLSKNDSIFRTLARALRRGTSIDETRTHAIILLKSLLELVELEDLGILKVDLLIGVVQVIEDQISPKATKAAIKVLARACQLGRNRANVVAAGAAEVAIGCLLNDPEKKVCEMVLIVVEQLCSCAEGRAALVAHAAGLAVVSKKILRVSHVASDVAIRILFRVCKFSANPAILEEMLAVGVVAKLCLVIQVDCELKSKGRAREILKMHARAWKNSPCVPSSLLSQ